MRAHIHFPFVDGPWGGGNQFLLALREKLHEFGGYEDSFDQADVIFFNSHHFNSLLNLYLRVLFMRRKGRKLTIIHRVDGPVSIVRGDGRDIPIDRSIAQFNNFLADGTIYQSAWSRALCLEYGVGSDKPSITIGNAPDSRYFYPKRRPAGLSKKRLRLVASSWSANWRKGFDIYHYLDKALDYDRFEFLFIGNSPIAFQNIKLIDPLDSERLGHMLRESDIYLTASVDDPCSNAVHEALHCGLPVVARDSGGHPEIVGDKGRLFSGRGDVLLAIDKVAANLNSFSMSDLPNMDTIAAEYMSFANEVHTGSHSPINKSPANFLKSHAKQKLNGLSGKIARRSMKYFPVQEAFFHSKDAVFRRASWEPDSASEWNEDAAHSWLRGVIARMPLFLDSMRHPNEFSLYRFSQSGDLNEKPSLVSSLLASQIIVLLGLDDPLNTQPLVDHILSFEKSDGSVTDSSIQGCGHFGQILSSLCLGLRSSKEWEVENSQTRMSWRALSSLGASPPSPFSPIAENTIDQYLETLDWSRPEHASEKIYNICFFLAQNSMFGLSGKTRLAQQILEKIEASYRRDDGGWYADGANVGVQEKINSARNMVFAMEVANICELEKPESLIDLCLGASDGKNARDKLAGVELLNWCSGKANYRTDETVKYFLEKFTSFQTHYWPWQGGFSFYPETAEHTHQNVRITSGMREPDLKGTAFILQGISLISDKLGWLEDFGLRKLHL